ncbi:hypothetical protein [Streptomyces alkaliterrae]|uniref:PH domain-containing protein n=1 Tax=Streptomyces alkaliterrae TaxID=2213162 RepID=A0A5P0YTZ3_9ACTN|nr:hypothetical protein [Streptomyces alkaliterrae]MBB1260946.1 hypothetical protein [Streptomyces alkaliterrae]MQS02912.1 hypothetical protein [Streptomyces alkaliterrae]
MNEQSSAKRLVLRRRSWLMFASVASVGFVVAYAVVVLSRRSFLEEEMFAGAFFFAIVAFLVRYGACRIVLNEEMVRVYGLFGRVDVPYASISTVGVNSGGGLEIQTIDGRVVTPLCFGGSLIDGFIRTADKAALAIHSRLPGSRSDRMDLPPVSKVLVRNFWLSDVFLALAVGMVVLGWSWDGVAF